MEFIGFTLETIGKILVAYTALRVHHRVWKEHSINKGVFRAMRREQIVGIIGIAFIVVGYVIQIPFKI